MKKIILFFIFLALMVFLSFPVHAHKEGIDKCLTAGFWVEDSVYNFFDPKQNPKSQNTFEEWADKQMAAWNEILEKSGAKDCFKMDTIVRVRDGKLPLRGIYSDAESQPDINNKTVDVQWGFPKSWLERKSRSSDFIQSILTTCFL